MLRRGQMFFLPFLSNGRVCKCADGHNGNESDGILTGPLLGASTIHSVAGEWFTGSKRAQCRHATITYANSLFWCDGLLSYLA